MFPFPLKRLLDYRLVLEKEAARELAQRRLDYERESCKLSSLQQEHARVNRFVRAKTNGALDLSLLSLTCEYTLQLNRHLEEQQRRQLAMAGLVEEQQGAVLNNWRQRRSLEILREKARVDFEREVKRRERCYNDEQALRLYRGGAGIPRDW